MEPRERKSNCERGEERGARAREIKGLDARESGKGNESKRKREIERTRESCHERDCKKERVLEK